jgi:hypothetical protein
MVPSVSVSPVREILEGRLAQLLPDLESALDVHLAREVQRVSCQVRAHTRAELADQLNQTARRIHQASTRSEAAATLVEAAAVFASSVALLSIEATIARGGSIRGVSGEGAASFHNLEISLESAPALAEAIRTLDPVTAAATPAEISAELFNLVNVSGHKRVFLCPVVEGGRVPTVICAWGEVQSSAIELLSQIAAGSFRSPDPSRARAHDSQGVELVQIEPRKSAPASAWDALSQEEQQIHLRAQRVARVDVSEMRLYEAEAVESGRRQRDLYSALRARIDATRESFRKRYFSATPTMVDYLHLELLRTLAHDDPDLLGKDYPGPLA